MSQRFLQSIKRHFVIFSFVLLSACGQTDKPTAEALLDSPSGALSDNLASITNYTQLYGSLSPFDRVTITAPYQSEHIRVVYKNTDNIGEHSQLAIQNAAGNYEFLVAPLSIETTNTYQVFVDDIYFGEISILPLDRPDSSFPRGEYSLSSMNSVLMGLREAVSTVNGTSDTSQAYSAAQQELLVSALQKTIEEFQTLISLVDDAVVFNSAVIDPDTSEVVLDYASLEFLDAIFLRLISNYSENSLFLDQSSEYQNSETINRLSFTNINNAVKSRLSTESGISALASLGVDVQTNGYDSSVLAASNVLDIVRASLVPAIVSNYARSPYAQESQIYLINSNTSLNSFESNLSSDSGFLYQNSLSTLQELTEIVSEIF